MATHIQDDYLICGEYQEQIGNKSEKHPGFITFKHENGNHYFAWVNGDQIILRSEAYPDEEKMERGIAAILKNCDLTERYAVEVEHGAHFLLLYGGGDHQAHTGNRDNHSEIGRSCPKKTAAELHELLVFKGKDFADKVVKVTNHTTDAKVETNKEVKVEEKVVEKVESKVAAAAAVVGATAAAGATLATNLTETAKTTVTETASKATSYATTATEDVKTGGMGWLKWLLPLLLIGAGLFFYKSCKDKEAAATIDGGTEAAITTEGASTDVATDTSNIAAATTTVVATDSANAAATTNTVVAADLNTNRASAEVMLKGGQKIKAYTGGVEERLVKFLDNASASFDAESKSANWYDFDNLNFNTGTSTISNTSMVQIENLAAILKAYPGLKIKVGGYTDKKGNDASNMKLSQSRADAVIAALKGKGTNVAQLTGAEGYGETLAKIAESASDEARRADRRTAVRVMAR
jgi:outer membrane protein OmpA-like peptidoglycan-associated protein/uncharacterized protein YegP (UPF0339 family)